MKPKVYRFDCNIFYTPTTGFFSVSAKDKSMIFDLFPDYNYYPMLLTEKKSTIVRRKLYGILDLAIIEKKMAT